MVVLRTACWYPGLAKSGFKELVRCFIDTLVQAIPSSLTCKIQLFSVDHGLLNKFAGKGLWTFAGRGWIVALRGLPPRLG